jgi:Kef-type K+ transport system membrane component KefB
MTALLLTGGEIIYTADGFAEMGVPYPEILQLIIVLTMFFFTVFGLIRFLVWTIFRR